MLLAGFEMSCPAQSAKTGGQADVPSLISKLEDKDQRIVLGAAQAFHDQRLFRRAGLDDFRALELWRDGKRKTSKRLAQDKGFDQELAAFVNAARNGAEMPISWRSLVLTTRACLRIEDALASGLPQAVERDV